MSGDQIPFSSASRSSASSSDEQGSLSNGAQVSQDALSPPPEAAAAIPAASVPAAPAPSRIRSEGEEVEESSTEEEKEERPWTYAAQPDDPKQAPRVVSIDKYLVGLYEKFLRFDHKEGAGVQKTGWKFHISIDDSYDKEGKPQQSNLEKGWNVVVEILMRHQVHSFKLVPKGERMYIDGLQNRDERGKQVTIYTFSQKPPKTPQEWKSILQEIESALRKAKVNPAHKPPESSRMTPSSCYISYRNDNYPPSTKLTDPPATKEKDKYYSASNPDYNAKKDQAGNAITPAPDPYITIRMAPTPESSFKPQFLPDPLDPEVKKEYQSDPEREKKAEARFNAIFQERQQNDEDEDEDDPSPVPAPAAAAAAPINSQRSSDSPEAPWSDSDHEQEIKEAPAASDDRAPRVIMFRSSEQLIRKLKKEIEEQDIKNDNVKRTVKEWLGKLDEKQNVSALKESLSKFEKALDDLSKSNQDASVQQDIAKLTKKINEWKSAILIIEMQAAATYPSLGGPQPPPGSGSVIASSGPEVSPAKEVKKTLIKEKTYEEEAKDRIEESKTESEWGDFSPDATSHLGYLDDKNPLSIPSLPIQPLSSATLASSIASSAPAVLSEADKRRSERGPSAPAAAAAPPAGGRR